MQYRPQSLIDARRLKGLTQSELARKVKLSTTTINQIELGNAPWIKALRVVASFLGVPLENVIVTEDKGDRNAHLGATEPRRKKAS